MPNLNASYFVAQDPNFRGKLTIAAVAAALEMLGTEDPASLRAVYASALVKNPAKVVEPLVWAVAADPTIGASVQDAGSVEAVTDEVLEATVLAVWDDVSGASNVTHPAA